jgi:hypothetical protein
MSNYQLYPTFMVYLSITFPFSGSKAAGRRRLRLHLWCPGHGLWHRVRPQEISRYRYPYTVSLIISPKSVYRFQIRIGPHWFGSPGSGSSHGKSIQFKKLNFLQFLPTATFQNDVVPGDLTLCLVMLYRWHLLHTLNNFYFSLWDGKDKNLNLWCALPGLYGVSETLPLTVLWIRISIGFGFNGVPGFVSRSGFAIRIRIRNPDPEGQKWPTKVRDVLLWGLKASPVAWTSFREA